MQSSPGSFRCSVALGLLILAGCTQTPAPLPDGSSPVTDGSVDADLASPGADLAQPLPDLEMGRCSADTDCASDGSATLSCCDGACIDTSSDVLNCGACGALCVNLANASSACAGGKCTITSCATDFADCDGKVVNGCEVNAQTDAANCGSCSMACGAVMNGASVCKAGACIGMCNALFGDCNKLASDGCEKSLATDVNNCGGCGVKCSYANAQGMCLSGQCGLLACNAGFVDCDGNATNGCEVNRNSDAKNCDVCGNVCPANTPYCSGGACTNRFRVAIVAALSSSTWGPDIESKLVATGAFAYVDLINGEAETPTLGVLQGYQAVLVVSNSRFLDPSTLGDNLADYFDGGGQVVVATFANVSNLAVTGRFGTVANGYVLLSPAAVDGSADTLGTISEPQSPLVAGVAQLSCGTCFRSSGGVINGGVVVAQWQSGMPLVVRGVVKGRNRVDLNLFPPSSQARSDFWKGDGANLLKNALLYR